MRKQTDRALPPLYETTLSPDASCWDATGHMRPSSLFSQMQEIAGQHASLLGLGREDLLPKRVVWVLSRVSYALHRPLPMNRPFRMQTWPGAPQKFLFPRWFRFLDEAGEELGAAASIWLLVDEVDHAIALPSRLDLTLPDTSHLPQPTLPGKLPPCDALPSAGTRTPMYSDIDVNRHMNNARYVEWICDALPYARMSRSYVARLQVNYLQEALPGEAVSLGARVDGDAFHVRGADASGKALFQAEGAFEAL